MIALSKNEIRFEEKLGDQILEIKEKAWKICCQEKVRWAVHRVTSSFSTLKWSAYKGSILTLPYEDCIEKTIKECLRADFRVDYTEQFLEYIRADKDKNEQGAINAICNMIIIALNAGLRYEKKGICWRERSPYILQLTKALVFIDSINDAIYPLVVMGYDPYKCLLETLKEFETKSKKWDSKNNQWSDTFGAYTQEEAIKISGLPYVEKILVGLKQWWVCGGENMLEIREVPIKRWHKTDYSDCKFIIKSKEEEE